MTNEASVTIVGNLTADPELRFTSSGLAVANLTVASTPRSFNRATQEWEDGETLFLRCTVWREYAENCAESLLKGHRVIVTGRLRQRSFTTADGDERTVIECDIDEIGPVLRYHTATLEKVSRKEESKPAAKPAAKAKTAPRRRNVAAVPDEPPF